MISSNLRSVCTVWAKDCNTPDLRGQWVKSFSQAEGEREREREREAGRETETTQ